MRQAGRLRDPGRRHRSAGFTMVELMVTIAIAAILLSLAMPALKQTITTSSGRNVATKFVQDFKGLRGLASTGTHTASLTLNANCTWSATVDGQTAPTSLPANYSLSTLPTGFSCAAGTNTTLPVTFTFTDQGYVSPSANFSFTAASGQVWTMQVLTSGAALITTGSS